MFKSILSVCVLFGGLTLNAQEKTYSDKIMAHYQEAVVALQGILARSSQRLEEARESTRIVVDPVMVGAEKTINVSVHVAKNNPQNLLGVIGGLAAIRGGNALTDWAFHFDARNLLVAGRVGAGDTGYEEAISKGFKSFGRTGSNFGKWFGKAFRFGGILTVLYNGGRVIYSVAAYNSSVGDALAEQVTDLSGADELASDTIAAHYAENVDTLLAQRSQFSSDAEFAAYVDVYLKGPDGDRLQQALIQYAY